MIRKQSPQQRRPQTDGDKTMPTPTYHLIVPCRDEDNQRELYEELRRRGYRCRVLSM